MAHNAARLLSTLLLAGVLGGAVSLIASSMTAKYLDKEVSKTLAVKAPYEKLSLDAFNQFEAGNDGMVINLEAISYKGYPLGNVLVMAAYSRKGDIQAQERHLVKSMGLMDDPDLLLLLTYGRHLFESKAQPEAAADAPQTALTPNDRLWLSSCFANLQERYSGRLGAIRAKYAYYAHTKSCVPTPGFAP